MSAAGLLQVQHLVRTYLLSQCNSLQFRSAGRKLHAPTEATHLHPALDAPIFLIISRLPQDVCTCRALSEVVVALASMFDMLIIALVCHVLLQLTLHAAGTVVLVLTWACLGVRYQASHFVGAALCVSGFALLVVSDALEHSGQSGGSAHMLLGDSLVGSFTSAAI